MQADIVMILRGPSSAISPKPWSRDQFSGEYGMTSFLTTALGQSAFVMSETLCLGDPIARWSAPYTAV